MKQKPMLLVGIAALVLIAIAGIVWARSRGNTPAEQVQQPKKVQVPVNLIAVEQRPYVEIIPLADRNKLQLVIHERKKAAETVEVVLEYDRNEGVMDAVLKEFSLTSDVQKEEIFLGSKSAGGHITYHEDVIGGTYTLNFANEDYALKESWRYSDTEKAFSEFSTSDGFFQVKLDKPYQTGKIVVMKSPGYPGDVDGEIIAGPYLFRGVGNLPDTVADVTIRTSEESGEAKLLGWDGTKWQVIEAQVSGRSVTANTSAYQVFMVTK
jgi:hypothetical protein